MVNLNQYIYKVKLVLRVMYVQGIYQIKQIYKGKFARVKLSVTGIDVIYSRL